jgi:hypothetical protein
MVSLSAMLLATSAMADDYRGTEADQMACTPDVFRLCESAVPDVDAIVACLTAKQSQLSPACAKVFGPASRERAKRKGGSPDGAF